MVTGRYTNCVEVATDWTKLASVLYDTDLSVGGELGVEESVLDLVGDCLSGVDVLVEHVVG